MFWHFGISDHRCKWLKIQEIGGGGGGLKLLKNFWGFKAFEAKPQGGTPFLVFLVHFSWQFYWKFALGALFYPLYLLSPPCVHVCLGCSFLAHVLRCILLSLPLGRLASKQAWSPWSLFVLFKCCNYKIKHEIVFVRCFYNCILWTKATVLKLGNIDSCVFIVQQLYNKRACPQTMLKILRLRRQRCQIKDNRVAKNMGAREKDKERA